MKIRLGFVSNSSSASYIVTLHKKFDSINDLLVDIYDTCWTAIQDQENDYFDQQALMKLRYPRDKRTTIIESPITKTLEQIYAERPERLRIVTAPVTGRNFIDSYDVKVDVMRRFLEYEGIEISETGNHIYQLKYYTVMHNSFNDMNSLLKNIYFEYLTEQGGANLNFESDN